MVELQQKTVLSPDDKISLGLLNQLCQQSSEALIVDIKTAVVRLYPATQIMDVASFISTMNELINDSEDKHSHRPAWSIQHHFLVKILKDCIIAN